jgi:hypothetical protein
MSEVEQAEEPGARREGVAVTPEPIAVRLSVPSPRITMRNYFSTHHLWTAIRHAHEAQSIEASHAGRSRFDRTHRGYVLSAILSSVAFLEAMVTELFEDAEDGRKPLDRATEATPLPSTSATSARNRATCLVGPSRP